MKTKQNFLIYTLVLMGFFLVFASNCKMDKNIPVLSTTTVTDITATTATSGGNITSDGGATVIARGVCWSTEVAPTISDNKTSDGAGAGVFTSSLSGLSPGTTYYLRAYATNSNGTGYGSAMSFTTSSTGSFTDSRDGTVYKTVTIGTQVWMAENLKYLPSVNNGGGSLDYLKYYVYDYNGTNVTAAKATANYATYGVLYNWLAAENSCPAGWHLPSNAEWSLLAAYLGSGSGGKLKETGTTYWENPNTGATNVSGFTGRPGGYYIWTDGFNDIGYSGNWWTSVDDGTDKSYSRMLNYNDADLDGGYRSKMDGFSVRCVKD